LEERIELLVNFFINQTGFKSTNFVENSLKVLIQKFDDETIMEAIEIVSSKYDDVKTYNDFFALTHGVCKNIYNIPRPIERL